MKFITCNNSKRVQNGYTLLFAVLTATLVLGVAVFILSVSKGQYLLASTARESVYAFYAADSGIECAAAVAKNIDLTASPIDNVTMTCNNNPYTIAGDKWIPAYVATLNNPQENSVTVDLGDSRCAIITFIKGTDNTPQHNSVTQIESRGYNYCMSSTGGSPAVTTWGPDPSNPRVVERAIRLTYTGM
jgi:hypothetical protein